MRPSLEHDISDYLHREASRVNSSDRLDDIERGVSIVAVAPRREQPRRMRPLIAAASIALVAALALARHDTNAGQAASVVTSPTTPAVVDITAEVVDISVAPTTALPRVPLPAGGLIQGISPSCSTTDSIVYDCTIPEYPADGRTPDMTNFTTIIVDDTSHVSGGCRSTSVDATRFTCYVGQRAVDEQIVDAGFLGDWAPQGYIAG